MKRIIENSLFASILGFLAFGAFFVFSKLFSQQDATFIETFQGAFLGAFFAFLFIRIADGLNKIYERHAKNSKALVILEHHFNDCGGVIHDDIYIVDKFLSLVADLERNPSLPLLYSNTLHPIPINKDNVIDLINIDYINDLTSYNIRTRKMNDSMQTLNNAYQQIKVAFVERHANEETYVQNVIGLKEELVIFKNFLNELLGETVKVLATARILGREKTFFSRIVLLTFKKRHSKKFKKHLEDETKTLKAEIEEVGKESRARIDRIVKQKG